MWRIWWREIEHTKHSTNIPSSQAVFTIPSAWNAHTHRKRLFPQSAYPLSTWNGNLCRQQYPFDDTHFHLQQFQSREMPNINATERKKQYQKNMNQPRTRKITINDAEMYTVQSLYNWPLLLFVELFPMRFSCKCLVNLFTIQTCFISKHCQSSATMIAFYSGFTGITWIVNCMSENINTLFCKENYSNCQQLFHQIEEN